MDPFTIGLGAMGLGSLIGGIGGYLGASESADAQRYGANQQLQGMREALAAQERAYQQQRADLAPFRQFGLESMGMYRDMAMNPNLDWIKKEREEATANLNAQLAAMGMSASGFAGGQHAKLQNDYASRMYQARLGAMQPLLGVGPSAAGGLANAAGNYGQGMAGTYQHGYGAFGQGMAQAGLNSGLGTSGAWGTFGNALGNAGALGAQYGMGSGQGGYEGYMPSWSMSSHGLVPGVRGVPMPGSGYNG